MGEQVKRAPARHEGGPAPASKAGAGHDIDQGRRMTKTEEDLRRVQSQYDPKRGRFDPEK